jgi:hypothetical protein
VTTSVLSPRLEKSVSPNESFDSGASSPESKHWTCSAGAGGATTAITCARVAKLRPRLQLFDGKSPRGLPSLCAECSSPAATAPRHYVRRSGSGAVGNGLDTTIKYLRRTRNGAAGAGLGTTIVTATNNCFGQLSDHHDHVSAWLRGHLPGYHDYVPCLVFVRGAPASELRS